MRRILMVALAALAAAARAEPHVNKRGLLGLKLGYKLGQHSVGLGVGSKLGYKLGAVTANLENAAHALEAGYHTGYASNLGHAGYATDFGHARFGHHVDHWEPPLEHHHHVHTVHVPEPYPVPVVKKVPVPVPIEVDRPVPVPYPVKVPVVVKEHIHHHNSYDSHYDSYAPDIHHHHDEPFGWRR